MVEDVVDALELSREENDLLGEQGGHNLGVHRLQEVGHAARGRYALGHHASDAVSMAKPGEPREHTIRGNGGHQVVPLVGAVGVANDELEEDVVRRDVVVERAVERVAGARLYRPHAEVVSAFPRRLARDGRANDVREKHRRRALNVEGAIATRAYAR